MGSTTLATLTLPFIMATILLAACEGSPSSPLAETSSSPQPTVSEDFGRNTGTCIAADNDSYGSSDTDAHAYIHHAASSTHGLGRTQPEHGNLHRRRQRFLRQFRHRRPCLHPPCCLLNPRSRKTQPEHGNLHRRRQRFLRQFRHRRPCLHPPCCLLNPRSSVKPESKGTPGLALVTLLGFRNP